MSSNVADGVIWILTISIIAWVWFMWQHGGK